MKGNLKCLNYLYENFIKIPNDITPSIKPHCLHYDVLEITVEEG